MAGHVASQAGAAGVVLDCTASEALADCYASWMGRHGLHIITPNKKLGAGSLERYQHLRHLQHQGGRQFLYEVWQQQQQSITV
jgi:aspartokinase/homoserine dehydrogenase 1